MAVEVILEILRRRREAVVENWLQRTIETYPEQISRFLQREKDPFRNPVGQALKEGLPALFDELAGGMDAERMTPPLHAIVRIRAVQDFTASEAVSFVLLLKPIVRREAAGSAGAEDLAAVEERIDRMVLLAFDLFVKCREKIYEIKADEARRRVYLLERAHAMSDGPGEEGT